MAISAGLAASAQAATVHVGSQLNGDFEVQPINGDFTLLQRSFTGGGTVTSPVDGTVISYMLVKPSGTFAIQVVRQSGEAFQAVANSTPASASTSGITPPIAVSLPIKTGDFVGLRNFGMDAVGAVTNGSIYSFFDPALNSGPPQVPTDTTTPYEIGLQATVRYCQVPKLKGKGPKAAKKALRAADCTIGKIKKTKQVRNKKKVLSQSFRPGTAISDTAPVNLKVSQQG